MNQTERYESAKEMYKSLGIDTDQVIQTLKNIPVSHGSRHGRLMNYP